MDPFLLKRFVHEWAPQLQHTVLQRVVCVADGLLLELRPGSPGGSRAAELDLLTPSGTAWALCLEGPPETPAALAAPVPFETGLCVPEATSLDALRAWLLRPATAAPGWMRLQGTRLRALRTRPGDRTLILQCEETLATGSSHLELVAELFDRSANFILRDAEGTELANWKGRRAAPERVLAATDSPPRENPTSLTEAAFSHLAEASARRLARDHRRSLSQKEKRLRSRVRALEADVSRARQGETWRRQAEALSAQLPAVRRGQSQVELEDLYAPGERLVVELDPTLAPHENAAALFKRARRATRGLSTSESRLQAAQREHAALQQALAEIAALESTLSPEWSRVLQLAAPTWRAALSRNILDADAATLWAPGGPTWESPVAAASPARRDASGPGRCFTLPGGWEVRVGRNNRENDELTHGFAHADDVWLHASGVPGSHVVLRMQGRKDNPPRDVLEMAAAIAARYSQAKHARTVPVIWTRKRYVRKPRRSAPGLATCTREKTLFVRPGLPSGQDDET